MAVQERAITTRTERVIDLRAVERRVAELPLQRTGDDDRRLRRDRVLHALETARARRRRRLRLA